MANEIKPITKDVIVENLAKFLRMNHLGNNPKNHGAQNTAIISAMNLLSDLKGYKVQYCRKSARPVKSPDVK